MCVVCVCVCVVCVCGVVCVCVCVFMQFSTAHLAINEQPGYKATAHHAFVPVTVKINSGL